MSSSKMRQKSALLAYGVALAMGFASGIFTSGFHLIVVLASWNSTSKTVFRCFLRFFLNAVSRSTVTSGQTPQNVSIHNPGSTKLCALFHEIDYCVFPLTADDGKAAQNDHRPASI